MKKLCWLISMLLLSYYVVLQPNGGGCNLMPIFGQMGIGSKTAQTQVTMIINITMKPVYSLTFGQMHIDVPRPPSTLFCMALFYVDGSGKHRDLVAVLDLHFIKVFGRLNDGTGRQIELEQTAIKTMRAILFCFSK